MSLAKVNQHLPDIEVFLDLNTFSRSSILFHSLHDPANPLNISSVFLKINTSETKHTTPKSLSRSRVNSSHFSF